MKLGCLIIFRLYVLVNMTFHVNGCNTIYLQVVSWFTVLRNNKITLIHVKNKEANKKTNKTKQ